ncbi:hypothetical protein KP806_07340 [Paenibacillus sp. N4]|uniref:hypothetical protein n=1 Tax=Paenibacillus vietnamensis TaxID=2590547 RepID=UPI001CD14D89|nr:hypothetical protein [Paenibacillus vietnamensis]MCA0754859.1 hypothetical protein [Paenibacillus vietnamensis]
MSRRLRPVPRRKLDIDRAANTEVKVRQMSDEERKRQAENKPREREFMTWAARPRKEVGD